MPSHNTITKVIERIVENKFQRGNLFEITACNMGDSGEPEDNLLYAPAMEDAGRRVYIQSTSTIESTISLIEIPFQGRRIKLPGDRTFGQWTVTFLSDASHDIKTRLEDWSHKAASLGVIKRDIHQGLGTWKLEMKDDDNNTTKIFEIYNCVPLTVGASNVSLADANNFITFPVTLGYSHFKIVNPTANQD